MTCPSSGTYARAPAVNAVTGATGCPTCGRHVVARRAPRGWFVIPIHKELQEPKCRPHPLGVDDAVK